MPVFHKGFLYTSRGYSSGPYMAVTSAGKVVWEVKTGAPYVSSLLYYDGLLYMATETGIASCVMRGQVRPYGKSGSEASFRHRRWLRMAKCT
jgi:hypothetical protein